jgi:hypothetical protein
LTQKTTDVFSLEMMTINDMYRWFWSILLTEKRLRMCESYFIGIDVAHFCDFCFGTFDNVELILSTIIHSKGHFIIVLSI